jgi:putative oxidoreductase
MNSATDGYLEKWGLLPLRCVVALVFLMHGGQKVLDFGVSGVADMLSKLGFVYPTFFAVVLMIIELAGGLAILFGLFTRIAGFVLAVEMAIAIYVARLGGGFFTPYGFEFELTLMGACLTFAAVGAGGASLDAVMGRRGGKAAP